MSRTSARRVTESQTTQQPSSRPSVAVVGVRQEHAPPPRPLLNWCTFRQGPHLNSLSIIDYYHTQLISNLNCPPTLRALSNFTGFGFIDGDQYQPGGSSALGVHWPTAHAASLQNVVFQMSDAPGSQHQGTFIESGSGGFMNDLVFHGRTNSVAFGNQQFTMRNLTFYNAVTAIDQIWDWGWTYKSIPINNCSLGVNMASGGPTS